MKTHANESQKRSLDEQLASGELGSCSSAHSRRCSPILVNTCLLTAGIQMPVVEGMTPQQVSNKIRNDKFLNAPRHQPPFPAAVEDDSVDELPPLR